MIGPFNRTTNAIITITQNFYSKLMIFLYSKNYIRINNISRPELIVWKGGTVNQDVQQTQRISHT